MQRLASRFMKVDRSEPAAFEHLAEVMERRDEVSHRFGNVRLQVRASGHTLFRVEIDQDQRPVAERCDACYDRSLELEHDRARANASEGQLRKGHSYAFSSRSNTRNLHPRRSPLFAAGDHSVVD